MHPSQRRAIVIFAKHAVPGEVKTRLVPPLTPARAATLARAMLLDSVAIVRCVAPRVAAEPFVFFAPSHAEPWFRSQLGDGIALVAQSDGNLTARLGAAFSQLHARGYTRVCFIGADSPTLPQAYLTAAFDALANDDVVTVGPADDGGYYLLGLAAPHLGVFADIDWSTPRVFAQTCWAIERLGLTLALLPPWYDVDDAASLERLTAELKTHADGRAAFTRAALRATRT